ncbi:MAG: hypothetical protein LAP38_12050 [Acidobacteriia bacterium]|nr:hypothetical protein [Terriglobia bacterium]
MRNPLVAMALAGCVLPLCAQPTPPPPVLQITRETIKEGKGAAHRRTEQDYANAFRKNKSPYNYIALTTESGSNEVWFASAYASFAALEESDKLSGKAPLKNDIELVEARDGELRASSRTMTAVLRMDMSYLPPNGVTIGKTRYVMIETFRVRLGHDDEFQVGAKMFTDAYRKANSQSPVFMYSLIAGAPEGTYLVVQPLASLKELDDEPARMKAVVDAMGAANFGRLMKSEGDVFQAMESTLFAVSPEMSYASKAIEDEDPGFWRPKASSAPAKSKESTPKTGQ